MSDAATLMGTPAEPAPSAPAAAAPEAPASPALPIDGPTVPTEPTTGWKWDAYAKDEDLGWLTTKGYKGPEDLIKAARASEKLIGHEKIPLPKDWADQKQVSDFYEKLGRPKTPADYKVTLPEGADKPFVDSMLKNLHAAGLSQKQVEQVMTGYAAYGNDTSTRAAAEAESARTQSLDALKVEWGMGTQRQVAIAQQGIDQFCPEGGLEKITQALGPADTLRFFNKLGQQLSEAKRVDGESGGSSAMTPAEAKYQISQKKMDRNFMEAYMSNTHPGHDEAIKEMTRLHKMASPE